MKKDESFQNCWELFLIFFCIHYKISPFNRFFDKSQVFFSTKATNFVKKRTIIQERNSFCSILLEIIKLPYEQIIRIFIT